MSGEPEHGHQRGIATWFALLLGPLLSVDVYLYQARVNQQEIDALYMALFAGVGGIAGLVMCVLDKLRARKKAAKTASHEIATESMPKPQNVSASELRRAVGAGFVAVSIFLLLIGRLFVVLLYPEFSKGEFTSDKVKVLLPVWTIGIIGLIMLLWPSKPSAFRSKEAKSNDDVE